MPKLHCPCGYIHNLSPIPDDGWITIPDQYYEDVIGAEIKRFQQFGTHLPSDQDAHVEKWNELTAIILKYSQRFYHCPNCGRIMWDKTGNGEYLVFYPDDQSKD